MARGKGLTEANVLEIEARNFEGMVAYSRKAAFVRSAMGDETGAAFWSGRARGLELAALNLRAVLDAGRLALQEAGDE